MAKLIQIKDGSAGIVIPIQKRATTLGRDESNDICLNDNLVSKFHAAIEITVNQEKNGVYEYIIQDLESTNNTYVNDQLINLHRLREGDRIRIGTNIFSFDDTEDQRPDETARLHKSWIPGVYYTKPK